MRQFSSSRCLKLNLPWLERFAREEPVIGSRDCTGLRRRNHWIPLASRAFGLARFGTIQGTVEMATFVFAGFLHDLRGDYVGSFTAFAGTNLLAVLAFAAARRRGLLAR